MLKLSDGTTAELVPVLHSVATAVQGVLRRTQRALDAQEDPPDFVAQIILLLVSSWSASEPLTLEGIAASPEKRIEALYTEALKYFRTEAEDALPQA